MRDFLAALVLSACLGISGFGQWRWSRNPEPDVVSYRIETHYAEASRYPCGPFAPVCQEGCSEEDPGCCVYLQPICVSYTPTASVIATVEPQEQVGSADICTLWDSGDQAGSVVPTLDSILYVDVRAVDSSGNVSN